MKYLSQIFHPVLTIPKDAVIKSTEITCKSQKLLLECGLVRPTASGLFALLPLARKALDKLETLVRHCMEEVGAQRMSLPTLTNAKLWEKTGRLQEMDIELLKVKDRHGKNYLLGPTHEEAVADLLADVGPMSYKQLPLLLYQITSKFRDEPRPKHGLLRSREFSMMDAYGAHFDIDCASNTYHKVSEAYRELFRKLELPVHRVEAPTGAMGGSLSHEWQLPAEVGEDVLAVCDACGTVARVEDDGNSCHKCGSGRERVKSVEVGHTFVLGTRYSDPLRANYTANDTSSKPLIMSCYGIGITRLLAASIEVMANDKALRWPEAIAPYRILIIGPKEGSKEWASHGWDSVVGLSERLSAAVGEDSVVIDDRHTHTIGRRMKAADRLGFPIVVVCGRSTSLNPPMYEVQLCRRNGYSASQLVTADELVAMISSRDDDQLKRQINV